MKQIAAYAESRGYVMRDQFTPAEIDLFWANWKLGAIMTGTIAKLNCGSAVD